VEPGEGALDDPAVGAQAGAVPCSAAGDGRHDAAGADLVAVDVVVVAPICEQRVRFPAGVSVRAGREWPGSRRSAAGAG
jgi:hypothetical protein